MRHVSHILGHARSAITLDAYTNLFEQARRRRPRRDGQQPLARFLAEATAPELWLKEDAPNPRGSVWARVLTCRWATPPLPQLQTGSVSGARGEQQSRPRSRNRLQRRN